MKSYLRGAAVFLLFPIGVAPAPHRAAPGVTFTATTAVSLSSELQQMLQPLTISGRGTAMPGMTRIDLDKVENAAGVVVSGDMLLASGSAPTIAVRPSLKTYTDLETPLQDQLAGLTGQAGDGVRPGDVPAQFIHLGAGEPIEGRATEHYQMKTKYVADAPGHSVNVSITIDVWSAKLAFPVTNPLLAFGTVSDTPIGGFRHKIASAFAALGPATPVMTVITTALSVGENNHEIVQTTTLTDIKPATIDPASLAVPAGFSASAR
jgi:hypothetical protein